MSPQCIVIGASAGGIEPLREIIAQLPQDFASPLFVVTHVAPFQRSVLPDILARAGDLPALHPEDGDKIRPGTIYVAPPDLHLLVNDGHVAVKRGPKENGYRPSIDALFRSAAYSYGPGVIGVVLSGALSDGASGLWSIKRLGGIAIVQEPRDALYPSMPRSAMEYVEPDYKMEPAEIGQLLVRLSRDSQRGGQESAPGTEADARRMAIETQIAAGVQVPEEVVLKLGELSPFTCPECRGTLVGIIEGNSVRFRCHTGHGYTADALLEGLTGTVADLIWQATRGSQETSMLLKHLAEHLEAGGEAVTARAFRAKARDLGRQTSDLRTIALNQDRLSEEKLADGKQEQQR